MNTLLRLGIVVLAFAAVIAFVTLLDSSPDDAGMPLAAGVGIAGALLVAVGAARA